MTDQSTSQSRSRTAQMQRLAEVAQGIAVVTMMTLGTLWAFSMHRSGLESPEGPAMPTPTPPPAVRIDPHPRADSSWTFYIVGSELEAEILRQAIADGDTIRFHLGLDSRREEVVVVNSAAEALAVVEMLHEGNRILASFGVEDRIVNLVS